MNLSVRCDVKISALVELIVGLSGFKGEIV